MRMQGVYRCFSVNKTLLAIFPTKDAAQSYVMEWVDSFETLEGMLKQARDLQVTYEIRPVEVSIALGG